MIDAAQRLKNGGADFIVIASNTMNSRADDIQATFKIPVLHIADATGEKVKESGIENVALLGTKFTMDVQRSHC
jgi:aspartate racemase